ncbi:MAG: chemotaxis protein CheW [Armatimonadota bacterium]
MVETMERNVVSTDTEEQLVIFTLGEEAYGVSIEAVNTIIRLPDITAVPHAPVYVEGVINLRGLIVPVINLRTRFGLPTTEATKATRVVVVENDGMQVGMVVDAVTETMSLPVANIEPLSPLVLSVDSRYLRGVGKQDERLIILLALDKVLSQHDAEALQSVIESTGVAA